MKIRLPILLLAALMLLLSACCVSHEWREANCTEPKTCSKCGKTEGEPLGHSWIEATCTEPKICAVCGEREGEPFGHDWIEATCTEPKTCVRCGVTEGDVLEHVWTEANYQDKAVCTLCGAEGDKLEPEWSVHGLETPKSAYRTTRTDFWGGCFSAKYEALEMEIPAKVMCLGKGKLAEIKDEVRPFAAWGDHSVSADSAPEGFCWYYCIFGFEEGEMKKPQSHWVSFRTYLEDYYTTTETRDSFSYGNPPATPPWTEEIQYTVSWHGLPVECTAYSTFLWDEGIPDAKIIKYLYDDYYRRADIIAVFLYCVPEGYDGTVIAIINEWGNSDYNEYPEGKYVYDFPPSPDKPDALYFRIWP